MTVDHVYISFLLLYKAGDGQGAGTDTFRPSATVPLTQAQHRSVTDLQGNVITFIRNLILLLFYKTEMNCFIKTADDAETK